MFAPGTMAGFAVFRYLAACGLSFEYAVRIGLKCRVDILVTGGARIGADIRQFFLDIGYGE